jgi:hypothetical protein
MERLRAQDCQCLAEARGQKDFQMRQDSAGCDDWKTLFLDDGEDLQIDLMPIRLFYFFVGI